MTMPAVFSPGDRQFAEAVRQMTASNPFLPARIAAARAALAPDFDEQGADWNKRPPTVALNRNHDRLIARCDAVLNQARSVWPRDGRIAREDAVAYEAMAGYWLYQTYAGRFDAFI